MCGKNNLGNLIHKNTMMHDQQASAATKSRQLFLKNLCLAFKNSILENLVWCFLFVRVKLP